MNTRFAATVTIDINIDQSVIIFLINQFVVRSVKYQLNCENMVNYCFPKAKIMPLNALTFTEEPVKPMIRADSYQG